jgi:hypothetical protein
MIYLLFFFSFLMKLKNPIAFGEYHFCFNKVTTIKNRSIGV